MATGACFGGYWNRCARGPQLAAEALNCRAASQWQLSWQIKLMISFDLKLKRYDFSLDVSGEFDGHRGLFYANWNCRGASNIKLQLSDAIYLYGAGKYSGRSTFWLLFQPKPHSAFENAGR